MKPHQAVDLNLCLRRCDTAGTSTPALRHASTVVRDTSSNRAATATDTPGNSLRLCSSKTPAASLTPSASSRPAAISPSKTTSATTCSACSYSLTTDIPHLLSTEQNHTLIVQH